LPTQLTMRVVLPVHAGYEFTLPAVPAPELEESLSEKLATWRRRKILKVKADLERELETWSLNCTKCGLDVHWVGGLGVSPGRWAHAEPAPHGEPAV
jgi:hypothetical protein